MNRFRALPLAFVLLLSTGFTYAQDRRGDYDRAITFFHVVQDALRKNDSAKLAELIEYPLIVNIHGRNITIHNQSSFIKNYSAIFTDQTRTCIIQSSDTNVWWKSEGYTVGPGIIWFDGRMPHGQNFPPVNSPDFWKAGKFYIQNVNGALPGECIRR